MHFGKARREGQGWLSLTSGATLSKGHQRPALRGFASKLPAALQTFERQPAFLHDCAFRAVSAQSLRHHLIDQRCLNSSVSLSCQNLPLGCSGRGSSVRSKMWSR